MCISYILVHIHQTENGISYSLLTKIYYAIDYEWAVALVLSPFLDELACKETSLELATSEVHFISIW